MQEIMMNAGRVSEDQASEQRTRFEEDIPQSNEEVFDDEWLAGVSDWSAASRTFA